ncbi:MAG: alpha/beta fold hydrolase [Acidimicrobiales bacterium]
MSHPFLSGKLTLVGHLARPSSIEPELPGLILCHGFPAGVAGAAASAVSFPQLADRIAEEMGWVVLVFNFRGAGRSEGDFSLHGWLDDLHAAIDHLAAVDRVRGIWLAGFGTGGALCVCAGAARNEVQGVAAMAAPADFDDWAHHPRRLLQHARDIGLITSPDFPRSLDSWSRELREIRPAVAVRGLQPRSLLVLHGSDDEAVPQFDARVVSDAHGQADLRIIGGAGHQLRHDPRALAVLLGWLDRQKHRV